MKNPKLIIPIVVLLALYLFAKYGSYETVRIWHSSFSNTEIRLISKPWVYFVVLPPFDEFEYVFQVRSESGRWRNIASQNETSSTYEQLNSDALGERVQWKDINSIQINFDRMIVTSLDGGKTWQVERFDKPYWILRPNEP
jgi:hypothetical protein